jgi:hypothetical protein
MPVANRDMRKMVLANVAITSLLIILFDVAVFLLLPERYLVPFPEYRRTSRLIYPLTDDWLRWYYVAHPTRGFDIGINRKAQSLVDGTLFPVWSNSIGCFDREHSSDSAYVYFAGDSFTWGHGAYHDNFGTLIEVATGTPIYKCGVEHTGQRHELAKLTEIVTRSARIPKAVFVFYFENDVANDYAYPHSTVIDGWMVDAVVTNSRHELIHRSSEELSALIERRSRDAALQRKTDSIRHGDRVYGLRREIARYSITANILRVTVSKLTSYLRGAASTIREMDASATTAREQARSAPPPQLSLYTIPEVANGAYWYLENPYAQPNKEALLGFKAWSEGHHAALVVVLIPRHRATFDPDFYAELHSFLKLNGIRFVDLASVFATHNLRPGDMYWRNDPHFNRVGNAMVARALLDSFPQYLGRTYMPVPGTGDH